MMALATSLDFTPDKLTLHWTDGSASQFHSVWLRDNILESDARHDTGQRLFDWSELPDDMSMKSAEISGQNLIIHFTAEERQSSFPLSWLNAHAYDRPIAAPDYQTWGSELNIGDITHDYNDVSQQGQAMCDWLKSVRTHGFAILQNVPNEEGMVCEVIKSFGFVRETNYGKLFEVRTEENPNNLAFTPLGLNVHTDNPYRTPVPGLQALHCLVSENDGGESVFVDGFNIAQRLKNEDQNAFDILSHYRANFRFSDNTTDLRNRTSLIGVNDQGHLTHIRYNNRSAAPLNLPADIMEDYYKSLLTMSKMLHLPSVEKHFKLAPGELVLFDNERILHGRQGFAGGNRHLQGTYGDKDALNSWIYTHENKSEAKNA